MKFSLYFLLTLLLFTSCSEHSQKAKILFNALESTYLVQSNFDTLPGFKNENYDAIFNSFKNNCKTRKAKKIYGDLCSGLDTVQDTKFFLTKNFTPYAIYTDEQNKEGLLTGYYEAQLHASLKKSQKYKYPLYETPNDLINIDLSSIYPELKHYRLRGRLEGNRLVPYDTRKESKLKDVNATVICYCNSKIDRFFLEIQGSGKVLLDDNSTMFVGYDNQNGHKYRAIGRYLVRIGALRKEDVSLQSIKKWLELHPSRVEEVLNYNNSLVYFKKRSQGATGALGLELTPRRSVAVDRKYIPLGSMLYLDSNVHNKKVDKIVFAQDTGGAIKGAVRADMFLGAGENALEIAGKLQSKLQLWILLPKDIK